MIIDIAPGFLVSDKIGDTYFSMFENRQKKHIAEYIDHLWIKSLLGQNRMVSVDLLKACPLSSQKNSSKSDNKYSRPLLIRD